MLNPIFQKLLEPLMKKHKPGSPLPWSEVNDYPYGRADHEYLVHAANAYPKLVKALSRLLQAPGYSDSNENYQASQAARLLLSELGEEA